ncbi:MAG: hypothetical protein ACYC0V_12730 [Armatimonadota bacterium]
MAIGRWASILTSMGRMDKMGKTERLGGGFEKAVPSVPFVPYVLFRLS